MRCHLKLSQQMEYTDTIKAMLEPLGFQFIKNYAHWKLWQIHNPLITVDIDHLEEITRRLLPGSYLRLAQDGTWMLYPHDPENLHECYSAITWDRCQTYQDRLALLRALGDGR